MGDKAEIKDILFEQEYRFEQTKWKSFRFPKKNSTNSVTKRLYLTRIYCAIATVIAASIGWIFVPYFLNQLILSKIVISQSTNPELYKAWIHPPVPVYFKVYLFSVTNPDDVLNGALPKFQEIGPYVFLENRTKLNIIHNDLEDTVTYEEYMSFHFQKDQSGRLNLVDKITLLNVPYVAAAIKIDDLPWPMSELGKTILVRYKEPIFIERTVEEVLFQGWKVSFLQNIEEDIGLSLIPNNTFAYFAMQNDTLQGPFTMFRGIHNTSSFGAIKKYKNQTSLNVWSGSTSNCNELKGTDGTLFPPMMNKASTLRIFNAEFCQSIKFNYVSDVYVGNIKAYRFTPRKSIQTKPEELECFCDFDVKIHPDKCFKKGVFDIRPCRDGAPIAVSAPHFLDADDEYIDNSGLKPNRVKHESILDVEPLTGAILLASKKIQINLVMKRVKGITALKRVPEMLFPMVWTDESGVIDKPHINQLEDVLFKVGLVKFVLRWPFLGFVLFTTSLWCLCKIN